MARCTPLDPWEVISSNQWPRFPRFPYHHPLSHSLHKTNQPKHTHTRVPVSISISTHTSRPGKSSTSSPFCKNYFDRKNPRPRPRPRRMFTLKTERHSMHYAFFFPDLR